jgi:hypothetical protein
LFYEAPNLSKHQGENNGDKSHEWQSMAPPVLTEKQQENKKSANGKP